MGKLAEALKSIPVAHQPEWKPKAVFDGTTGYVETGTVAEPPREYTDLLRRFDLDPDEVEIVGSPRVSKWQSASGEWLSSYRFNLQAKSKLSYVDFEAIKLAAFTRPAPADTDQWLNVQFSDLQLGKIDGLGIEEILRKYYESLFRAVDVATFRPERTTPNYAGIHLMFLGDCIEGTQSQGGKNVWRTELTITDQVTLFRRLLLAAIREFAHLTPNLMVSVVNGNHDEAERRWNTQPGDGWATNAAVAIADALKLNPAYDHVTIQIPPPEQSHMTVDVGGTIFTLAHGHKWRKGKHFEWWQEQAFSGHAPGAAHILAHGHEHEFQVSTKKNRYRICSSTLDDGSAWWADMHGDEAMRGCLIYTTQKGVMSNLSLV